MEHKTGKSEIVTLIKKRKSAQYRAVLGGVWLNHIHKLMMRSFCEKFPFYQTILFYLVQPRIQLIKLNSIRIFIYILIILLCQNLESCSLKKFHVIILFQPDSVYEMIHLDSICFFSHVCNCGSTFSNVIRSFAFMR